MFPASDTTLNYGKLKRFWRRKQYQRLYPDYGTLNGSYDEAVLLSNRKKRYSKVERFGGGNGQEKINGVPRRMRLRMSPKLRLKKLLVTPVMRILRSIRDGYLNMMLGVAGNGGSLSGTGNGVFGGKRVPKARQINEKKKNKVSYSDIQQFETKLVYEIYKVMAASRQSSTIEANKQHVQ